MTESQANTINANLTPLPDKVGVDGLEDKWRGVWDGNGTYKFQGTRDRKAVYSIDTPPPTVSGHLHVGHVFSYTHTDIIARFKRMNGFDVFYPMGWDDNGLPTERRVQNYYGVRVDTSLKYDPNFVPPFEGTDGKKIDAKDQVPISRKNFIELCEKLTAQDEKQFEALWRSLGLSIDWSQTYHTIGEHPQRVAQKAFLRNLARGEAYQKDAPGLWDVTFQTAVAQAELESREYPGFYHKIAFRFEDGTPIYIETTRPELLAACGARVNRDQQVHYLYPGDSAYVAACEENAALPCVLLGTNDMTQNTLELAAFERVYMLNADDAQGVAPALDALDEKPDGFILFERYHDEANVETVLRETGLESAELLFEHQYHVYWVH